MWRNDSYMRHSFGYGLAADGILLAHYGKTKICL